MNSYTSLRTERSGCLIVFVSPMGRPWAAHGRHMGDSQLTRFMCVDAVLSISQYSWVTVRFDAPNLPAPG